MPDLVDSSTRTQLIQALVDHFDTFKRTIKVYKEPKKVIQNADTALYAGYGNQEEKISYVSVSQEFSAIVSYKENQEREYVEELKIQDMKGDVRIKVEQDCRDYIVKNGKTESIEIDGKIFNIVSDDGRRDFLDKVYYVFFLESTR
tara:strand:- start:1597 stop:2034 length:438 start_codon:yes stop_codon:yes gene_type:complete